MIKHRYLHRASLLLIGVVLLSGCTSPELNPPKMVKIPASSKQTTQKTVKQKFPQTNRQYYPPTPQKEAIFNKEMRRIALSTQNDPKYHRMALNTPEEKAWFKNLMYKLWDRQITRNEFIALGLQKYPTHRYEFEFIANGFQK
jgi:hypothetical protein